jgi:uncharacterized protein YeaO (DUF488 family)
MSLQNFIVPGLGNNIRTDCYFAVLSSFLKKFPTAHYEFIARFPPNWFNREYLNILIANEISFRESKELSPSIPLHRECKSHPIPFDIYRKKLIFEFDNNPDALKRIHKLALMSQEEKRLIFLICFEKHASICHRSIVKQEIIKILAK